MRLKLRALTDGQGEDVLVDVDPQATAGELARALFPDSAPASSGPDGLGLIVDPDTVDRRIVPPGTTMDASGVMSGCAVGPSTSQLAAPAPRMLATLTVHDGPDAPRTVPLRAGRHSIGRSDDCDVRLTDPFASKRHAEVIAGDIVEIVDRASANGVLMSGRPVPRAVLRSSDRVVLGATTISVEHHDLQGAGAHGLANDVPFNRSPRLDQRDDGIVLVAPEPPAPPAAQRFPVATVVAPIVLAAVLFVFTRNVLSILFFALSPVIMVGSWWETRAATRRQAIADSARFRCALRDLAAQLDVARSLERAARRREHPSVVEVIEAVEARAPLVWSRRPDRRSFGHVRLGLGTETSRNSVQLPSTNETLPGLWQELTDTVAGFVEVSGVPVVADVTSCGNIGVGGPERVAEPVVRGLLAQFVGLHSPTELHLAAFAPADRWDWLKWLPHTDAARLAGNTVESAELATWIETLVDERRSGRTGDDAPAPLPRVIVLVHDDAPVERCRLVQLAEHGPDVGVHLVWFSASVERLPAACRAFVDVDPNTGRGVAGFVHDGRAVADLEVEPAGIAASLRLARRLSPLVDSGAPVDTSEELPRSIAFLDVAGHDLATSPEAIAERWRERESVPPDPPTRHAADRGLRAVVGHTVDGPIQIDLRSQGPHALVGGTTGSGKSEFLQTWILGMAAANSPARVSLLLVDYKGGAAFADCVELPHCVGLVTDLSPHLVRRALSSLDAELRHREQLLHRRRAKDLVELERRGDPDCPPSLVIVVDEFAALVAEVPEFVDGVVNVAQRGRSLGLHLVLATQRPAGVIRDNLRANTNLRVALRMADEGDSDDVIGSAEAAWFDPDVPGRAILKSGPGRVRTFQAAYSGGHVAGRTLRRPIAVETLRFGPSLPRDRGAGSAAPERSGPSDLRRVVQTVGRAAELLHLPAPRRPWLPELASCYRLEELPTARTDDTIVFGVVDDPDLQRQPVAVYRPDVDGNLAVYGTGGTGKSGTLRTIGLAAGFGVARGGPVWVYGLDFGSRGLRPLVSLPHVGGIITGDDTERVQRLLRFLTGVLDDRAERFAQAEAATIVDYRRRSGDDDEARIIVLVDGVGSFRTEYEGGPLNRWWEQFLTIAAEGRALGVHVVMSAARPSAVPSNLAASVQRRLVLRLANDMDYALAAVPADAYESGTPPGRGFLDGLEVQVAAVGGIGDLAEQARSIDRCTAAMIERGVAAAPTIGSLPAQVSLSELDPGVGQPLIGLGDDTLEPLGFQPAGTFLVAGAARSGRSTAVATMIRSLAADRPDTDFVLFGQRRSPLTSVTTWAAAAFGPTDIAQLALQLAARLGEAAGRSIVIVIEAIGELLDTEADLPLQDLVRECRDHGAFVIAEGETSTVGGSWPLLHAVKSSRCGIVLQPDQMDGEMLFKSTFPRTTRAEFPAGRGLMVQGGRVQKVQVALPE